MKKFVKALSLSLAIIMLVLALPIMGAARTLTTTEDNLSELPLIFSIDNLADTTNDAPNSNYKVTGNHKQNVGSVSGNDIKWTAGNDGACWMSYMNKTDIPLNETSQYVITFDATAEMAYRIFGFTFSGTNNNDSRTVAYDSNKYYYIAVGMQWVGTDSGKLNPTNPVVSDVSGTNKVCDMTKGLSHSYVMTINNKTVTLIRDGLQVYQYSVNTIAPSNAKYLTLGWRGRGNANVPSDGVVATMSNIKVYQGIYEQRTVNNYADGEVLLKMDSIFNTQFTSEFEDLKVTQRGYQAAKAGEDPHTIYSNSANRGGWVAGGVNTNLPLNENTRYTVDFYMKRNIAIDTGFCWSAGANANTQGILCRTDYIISMGNKGNGYGDGLGQYGRVGDIPDLWYNGTDNEGYVRFTLQINGLVTTVYVNGERLGTVDVGTDGYGSSALSLVMRNDGNQDYLMAAGEAVASVKDVTVYAGIVTPPCKVELVKDGKVFDTKYVAKGGRLSFAELPVVEPEAENGEVRWFYEGTDVMVLGDVAVDGTVILEARELDTANYTTVAGMQYTAPANNKQSIRFIADLFTLDAEEVGFEVSAKYKVGDTVNEDKKWNVKSTVVYSSINASENGTVRPVTAEQLGGKYLVAISVDGVPTNIGQIDFHVRSYMIVDGVKQYSEWAYFVMEGGAAKADAELMPVDLSKEYSDTVLRFVVASDIHIDGSELRDQQFEKLFTSAYGYANAQTGYNALDAILIAGDCTDNGKQTEMDRFFEIAYANTQVGTKFGAVLGNHETYTAKVTVPLKNEDDSANKQYATQVDAMVREMFTKASGLDEVNHHYVINGYHFILISTDSIKDGSDTSNKEAAGRYYTSETFAWLKEQLAIAAADDPTGTKPIFCIEHVAPSNTATGGTENTNDDLDLIYREYPQVVTFFGHSHTHINCAISIDQDYYTGLNTGAFKGQGLAYYDKTGTVAADNATDAELNGRGCGYYIIEVDANNVVKIQAYDIYDEDFYYEPKYTRVGDRSQFVFTDDRANEAEAPAFAEDAEIAVDFVDEDTLTVSFDQASGKYMTLYYNVELLVDGTAVETKKVRSGLQWIDHNDTLITTFDAVPVGTEYSVRISAVDEWMKVGEAITYDFAPTAAE